MYPHLHMSMKRQKIPFQVKYNRFELGVLLLDRLPYQG